MTIEVTVLMPMRNAASYVRDAVMSVLACRSVSIELLVIDDGSTDDSRAIVEKIGDNRIRIISGPCQGIAAAMNEGLAHARGAVLMRCDADDLFAEGRIDIQAEWMRTHEHAVAVCGAFEMIDSDGAIVASPFADLTESVKNISMDLRGGVIGTHLCTYAIRSHIAVQTGFRPYFETAEDLDFASRLAEHGDIFLLNSLFYSYRVHGNSITHTQKTPRRQFYENMARQFALQRLERGFDDLMIGTQPAPPSARLGDANSANRHVAQLATGQAWRLFHNGQHWRAICASFFALRSSPFESVNWITVAKIMVLSTLRNRAFRKQPQSK